MGEKKKRYSAYLATAPLILGYILSLAVTKFGKDYSKTQTVKKTRYRK